MAEPPSGSPTPVGHPSPGPDDFPAHGPNSIASIGQRAAARIIDLVMLSVPAMLLLVPFVKMEGETATVEAPRWIGAVALAMLVAYESVLVAVRGQTVGKWAAGVRVARYVDGKNPTFSQSLMRCLLPASFLAIPIPIVDMGWVVVLLSSTYHPMGRGWHDRAGGTVVVRTR